MTAKHLWVLVTASLLVAPSCYARVLHQVYQDPGLCFERDFQYVDTRNNVYISIDDVIACLKKIKIESSLATEAVSGFNSIFSSGYGYYYYNNDVLESSPIYNPYNWTIFNGTSGGQVNYDQEFKALVKKINREGADGMLLYHIQDILSRSKDAHTSGIGNNVDAMSMVSRNKGSDRWLSMEQGDNGEVYVVGYDAKDDEPTGIRLVSINGEEPIGFLVKLLSNPAMGHVSKFKSPGTRMTNFLQNMMTDPGPLRYCCSFDLGDISTLPSSLNLEFEDGVQDEWIFMIRVPDDYLKMPVGELIDTYNSPVSSDYGEPLYTTFQNMKNNVARKQVSPKTVISEREYDITIGNPVQNPLSFTIFTERNPSKDDVGTAEPSYSAYTVVNDTMIWKLTTFSYPNQMDDLINFWNDLVSVAKKESISTLVIDVSGNGGGKVTNVATCIQMLFPEAILDDVVASQTTRISDILLKIGNDVQPIFEQFLDVLVANVDRIESKLDAFDFSAIKNTFDNGYELSLGVNPSSNRGPFQDNWVTIDWVEFQKLDKLFFPGDGDESSPEDILTTLRNSARRPASCTNTTCYTISRNEGGVEGITVTDFFKSAAYQKKQYDFTKKYATKTPFSKYILVSDGNAGSATDRMVSTLRFLSEKYQSPTVVTVGYGGSGQREGFAMTQFSGGVSGGQSVLSNMYALYTSYRVLGSILTQIQKAGLAKELRLSNQDISTYQASVRGVLDMLPQPPIFSKTLPQYVWAPVYNQMIPPDQTIPQEFWDIPPEKYIPFWARPGGSSLFDQSSLQEIYENAIRVSQ